MHRTVTRPPAPVNFTAFVSRLRSIWRAFSSSARTASRRPVVAYVYVSPFAASCGAMSCSMSPSSALTGTRHEVDLDVARLEPREVQHVVDEPQQVPLASHDAAQVLPLLRLVGPADPHAQQLDVARDRVERRAELMAHRREKLGLRAVRLLRRLARAMFRVQQRTRSNAWVA